MNTQSGSNRVIVIAFFANFGISIAKFTGAFFSGSAALLAEAIHSLVDCSNQVLLLIGIRKSRKPPDDKHPLGYGREAFYWSFIVAILLFSLGGLFAIYEGIHKLSEKGKVTAPLLGLAILVFSLGLEAYSFWACYKEVKAQNKFKNLWTWFRKTNAAELLVIFTEDAAALLGLIVATLSLLIAWITGDARWDAIGSIAVGSVLVTVAILLGFEIKSFIIGESAEPEITDYVNKSFFDFFPSGRIFRCINLSTGSSETMMSLKIDPGHIINLHEAIYLTNQYEKAIKEKFPQVRWLFIELDRED